MGIEPTSEDWKPPTLTVVLYPHIRDLSSFNEVSRPLQDVEHIRRYIGSTTLTNASTDSSDHVLKERNERFPLGDRGTRRLRFISLCTNL